MFSLRLPDTLLFLICFLGTAHSLSAQNTLLSINGPDVVCAGSCATFSAVLTGSGTTTTARYEWRANNNASVVGSGASVQVCFNTANTSVTVSLRATLADGTSVETTRPVRIQSAQRLQIISGNANPLCAADTADTDEIRCEKVCPNTTVTYFLNGAAPAIGQAVRWQVNGARRFRAEPSGTAVTVEWGSTGTGTVSVEVPGACGGQAALCVTIVDAPRARIDAFPVASNDTIVICRGQKIWLDGSGSAAESLAWLYSDGGIAAGAKTEKTYDQAGLYRVSLLARSACVCVDTARLFVRVLDAASPQIACATGTHCPGAMVDYSIGNNPGRCSNFTWDISPNGRLTAGGAPGDTIVSVEWLTGPVGVVSLRAQNCTAAACPTPTVARIPIVSDAAKIRGPQTVCANTEAIYSIDAFGGTQYVWSLSGGGNLETGPDGTSAIVRWSAAPDPNRRYWLTVQYNNCWLGCSGRDSLPVQVRTPFGISGPERGCAGTNASFTAALVSGGPIDGAWSLLGPDNRAVWSSAGAPAASVSLPLPVRSGLYRLQMQAANASLTCTPTAEWPVEVSDRPNVLSGIVGDSLFCPGDLITYATSGSAATTVQWRLQNGLGAPVSLAGNPVNIAWRTTGPHRLLAWAGSAEGCSSDTVSFRARPVSTFNVSGASVVCEGATGTYRAPALQSAVYEWKIQPPTAGAIARGQGTSEVEIFWQQPGGHVLTATLCGQTEVIPVTVWSNPNPAVVLPAGVCPGKQTFIKTTTPFDVFTWRDAAGAVISSADSIPLGPGNYSLEVKSGLGCSSALGFRIAAAPAPVVAISTSDPAGFCNNSRTVKLQALTNTEGDYRYTWRRDGSPTAGNTGAVSTNQYGTYTVEVSNAAGCTAVSNPLTLFSYCGGNAGGGGFLPVNADFCPAGSGNIAFDPAARCDSVRARIVPGTGYTPGSATWTFFASGAPALGTRSGDTATFIFPNAGQYLALASIRLQNGTSCLLLDSVKVAAVARFEQVPACANDSTTFRDISAFLPGTGIANWQWNFGEPASGAANLANGRLARHAYRNGGVFTAQLTITANSGCTSTARQTIGIPVQPTPTIIAPDRGCAGQTAAFIAPRQSDWTNIVWNFDDPASDVSNRAVGDSVFHRFANAGTYRVSVTVANTAACVATVTHTIDIRANGLAGNINPARPPVVCAGLQTLLTAPSGATSYRWSNGAATQTLAASTEGVYRVTLTDANGCQYAPPPVAVSIRPGPPGRIRALLKNEAGQTIGLRDSSLRVCAGTPVHLFAASSTAFSFRWSNGQTGPDLLLSPSLNNALPVGSHQFTVTVTDPASGCTTVTPIFTVQVDPLPAALSIAITGQACAGANSELRLSGSPPTSPIQLRWNTGQTTPTLAARSAGTYFLTAVNEFGCVRNSNSIAVRPPPGTLAVPSGCHDRCKPDTICVPPVPAGTRWQWQLNGALIPGATNPRLAPQQNGDYRAVLRDAFGCTATSDPLSLQVGERIGVVSGLVWADVNKNGRIDPGVDTLTREVPVRLLRNDTLVGDTRSGIQGNFSFMSQPTGFVYVARVDSLALPKGWRAIIGRVLAPLQGCGAAAQVAFLVLPRCQITGPTVVVRVCAGDSATYEGRRIPPGGRDSFIYQTRGGDCDSTVMVLVSAYPASSGRLDTFGCTGSSLRFGNLDIPTGSSQRVVLKNFRGCDSVLTVNVLAYPPAASVLRASVCRNESFRYEGASILPGEMRTFRLKTWRGCDSVVTVTVDSFPTPVTTLRPKICVGSVFVYQGSSLGPGSRARFGFRSFRGCDSIVNVVVESFPSPRRILTPRICAGETFRFDGKNLKPGEAEDFTFKTDKGCDSVISVIVSAWPAPRARLETFNACRGRPSGSVALRDVTDGTPPYRYSLDRRSFQPQSIFGNLPTGNGTLYLTDSTGCQYPFPYSIDAAAPLETTLLDAILPCDSTSITLAPQIGGDTARLTFRWWNGSTQPTALTDNFGPVWVSVATRCDSLRRTAIVRPGNFRAEGLAYVPNVFAPEGASDDNGQFMPLLNPGAEVRQYSFRVYDRWGTQLFAAAAPDVGWDGIFQQKMMQPGVYVWVLDAQIFYCGREKRLFQKGDVTIVR